jgi:hypothetical protein
MSPGFSETSQSARDNEQQGPVNVSHGANLRKLKHHKKMASFSHTGSRSGRQNPAARFGSVASMTVTHLIAAAA